jgi:phospholipid transport system substrate-binding protein
MTAFYFLVVISLASLNIAHADISTDGQKAIVFTENSLKPALNKILTIHKKSEMDPEQKRKIYDETIFPLFDYPMTARLTLGGEQWKKLTDKQKERFIHLFGRRLQNFYLQRLLLLHPDMEVIFKKTVQEQNRAVVNTELRSSYLKTNREVQYKIRYAYGKWKIYDLDIKGISILRNYRVQFKKFLNQHTVEDLLKNLEKNE